MSKISFVRFTSLYHQMSGAFHQALSTNYKTNIMRTLKVIGIGIIIWMLGVSIYTVSFYIPLLENLELQANIALSLGVLPLVWLGAKRYYNKKSSTKGYWLGVAFFATAAILDALITVPLFIIPHGGNHYEFFTAFGFWLIGMEFIITATVYWFAKVKSIQ